MQNYLDHDPSTDVEAFEAFSHFLCCFDAAAVADEAIEYEDYFSSKCLNDMETLQSIVALLAISNAYDIASLKYFDGETATLDLNLAPDLCWLPCTVMMRRFSVGWRIHDILMTKRVGVPAKDQDGIVQVMLKVQSIFKSAEATKAGQHPIVTQG